MFTPSSRTPLTDAWPTKGGLQRAPEAFMPLAPAGRCWGCPGMVLVPDPGRAAPLHAAPAEGSLGRGGRREAPARLPLGPGST